MHHFMEDTYHKFNKLITRDCFVRNVIAIDKEH